MAICPAGHTSTAEDYCDICGLPVTAGPGAAPPVVAKTAPAGALCPNCGTTNAPDALFCEACGYDFTTGTMPRSASPALGGEGRSNSSGAQSPGDLPGIDHGPDASSSLSDDASPAGSIEGHGSAPQGWPTLGLPPTDVVSPTDATPASPDAAPAHVTPAAAIPQTDGTPASPGVPPAEVTPAADIPQTPVIPANAGISDPAPDESPAQHESPAAPAPTPPSRRPLQARPTSVEWVAEVWIDPDWYATQGSTDALPSPGLPDVLPLRSSSALIGRTSRSRNIHPDIDCALDSGVSRRHAQVTSDGSRWWIEDLESANGTFVGPSAGPLPTDPIGRGRVEFAPDQRIYLGAWTRIVIRAATDDEKQAFNA